MDLTNNEGFDRLEYITVFTEVASCLVSYIYFVLNSAKVKKKWKCDSEKLFEWKLVFSFVLYYLQSRFFRKGFDVNRQKSS